MRVTRKIITRLATKLRRLKIVAGDRTDPLIGGVVFQQFSAITKKTFRRQTVVFKNDGVFNPGEGDWYVIVNSTGRTQVNVSVRG